MNTLFLACRSINCIIPFIRSRNSFKDHFGFKDTLINTCHNLWPSRTFEHLNLGNGPPYESGFPNLESRNSLVQPSWKLGHKHFSQWMDSANEVHLMRFQFKRDKHEEADTVETILWRWWQRQWLSGTTMTTVQLPLARINGAICGVCVQWQQWWIPFWIPILKCYLSVVPAHISSSLGL